MGLVVLPTPRKQGDVSLEECLAARRSLRAYALTPLSLAEAGQLLWAAQGISSVEKQRTAPSAGALYPLEVYLVAALVDGLPAGVYRYEPYKHQLLSLHEGDWRRELAAAALDQDCVRDAAAIVVFTANYRRTTRKYGDKGTRYVEIEVGHAAQNVLLQAVALGLGGVPVAAFDPGDVQRILRPATGETPVYMVPVGRPPGAR
jgi:SagB-type dehydrogenase family enzyme